MKFCLHCDATLDGAGWDCPRCGYSPEVVDGRLAFAPALSRESLGFQASYFRELAELESRSFWFRTRNRLVVWALRKYFPQAGNLLEIGCGTGFVLSGIATAMPAIRLSGSEIFSEGLGFAAARLSKASLFQMDARQIPFDGEFDVIGAFDALEHIQEDELVLAEMFRATRPGGGIVLTVPQHTFLWSRQDEHACHVRRYESRELEEKVRRAGFTVERSTSFVALLLPLLVLSRRRKQAAKQFDTLSELRIGRVLNGCLEAILDVERLFIWLGGSFPRGGSLLLVARKP